MIVLAGGRSSRLGKDKGLIVLNGRPLVRHVFDRIAGIVDERIVVVRDQQQLENFRQTLSSVDRFVCDSFSPRSALAGMMTGLSHATGEHSVVLPCDSPFVSPRLVEHLFDQIGGCDAMVPRWPYGYIEPLQSVYKVSSSFEIGKRLLAEGKNDFRSLIDALGSVLYVPVESLTSFSPELRTFFNVNNVEDLEEATRLVGMEDLGE